MVLPLWDFDNRSNSIISGNNHHPEESEEPWKSTRRASDVISLLSFSSLEEMPAFEEASSSAPWKISLKKTGKGQDIRQGANLASPITFFPKDDSRLIHDEANSLQLKHAEQLARKGKASTDLDTPNLKTPKLPQNTGRGRSKSPMPALKKAPGRTQSQPIKSATSPKKNSLKRITSDKPKPAAVMEEKKVVTITPPAVAKPKTLPVKEEPPVEVKKEPITPPKEVKLQAVKREPQPVTPEPATPPVAPSVQVSNLSDKRLSALENQLKALQQQLLQSQKEVSTSEKKEKRASCDTCEELKGSLEVVRRESAEWKAHQQAQGPCRDCAQLKTLVDSLREETKSWKVLIQQSLEVTQQENQLLKEQLKAQAVGTRSLQRDVEAAKKEGREAKSSATSLRSDMEHRQHDMQTTLTQLQSEVKDFKGNSQQGKDAVPVSRDVEAQVEHHQAELQSLRQDLQQSREESQKVQTAVTQMQAEADAAKQKLEQTQQKMQSLQEERDRALSQQATQLQTSADERKALVKETNAKLTELSQVLEKNQKDKSALRAEFKEGLGCKESRVQALEQQTKAMLIERDEIQQKLELQTTECKSIRQELCDKKSANEKAMQSIAELKEKVNSTSDKYDQVQKSLETLKKEHEEALNKLQASEAESREFLQQSWQDNSTALSSAHDRIADLEATVQKTEEARQEAESRHSKKLRQQERSIEQMQQRHEELQQKLDWNKTEKETLKNMIAEKAALLKDAQNNLATLTEEKDMVLGQVNATTREETTRTITASEQMNTILEEDELEKRLSLELQASANFESDPDLRATARHLNLEIDHEEVLRSMNMPESADDSSMSEIDESGDEFEEEPSTPQRRDSFEFDEDELLRAMNMPDSLEDSVAFLGCGWDHQRRQTHRMSSITKLEELEADLRDLLDHSDGVVPASRQSMMRGASMRGSVFRRGSMLAPRTSMLGGRASMLGGRQMSFVTKQKQRDSAEEEVLSEIRNDFS